MAKTKSSTKKTANRAPNYTGSIKKRDENLWEGQYYHDNKRKSTYGNTEDEVRVKLNTIYAQILENKFIPGSMETVAHWLNEWLDKYAGPTTKATTYISYEGYVRNHVIPYIGHIKLKNLKHEKVQAFFTHLAQNGRKDRKQGGLALKTIRNIRNMLSQAFNKAISLELMVTNPVVGVKLHKADPKEARVFDEEEFQILVKFCENYEHPVAKAIIVLLYTGIRKGEMLGLMWPRVNFSDPHIKIRKSLTRISHPTKKNAHEYIRVDTWAGAENKTGLYLGSIKTQKGNRTIPLAKKAKKALEWLRNYHERMQELADNVAEEFNPHRFVLVNELGRPLDPKYLEEWFKNILKLAGVEDANLHATRHTFATRALAKSKDIKAVSELLGHANTSTTYNMYVHTFDDAKKKVVGYLDEEDDQDSCDDDE